MSWKIIIGFIVVLLLNAGAIFYFKSDKQKSVYVLTQRVFEEFHGTKDIKKKLNITEEAQKEQLDSLKMQISLLQHAKESKAQLQYKALVQQYHQQYNYFTKSNEELMSKYNTEIWKQLNDYVQEYGKNKGYAFVFGADGTGTLMYANESENITEEVIAFVNKKYSGK